MRRDGAIVGGFLTLALAVAIALALAVLFAGCGGDEPERLATAQAATTTAAKSKPNRFDGPRAFKLIRRQVEGYGQRPAGSPQLRRLAEELRPKLPNARFEDLPDHPGMRNIVGRIPGRQPAIVVGAHYDTEVEPQGFVGANDSAAGTAALIEVARAMRKVKRGKDAPELRFVLFDGEEEPRGSTDFYADALRGSKAYVVAHGSKTRKMVLLDYIANRGLRLPREGSSDVELWGQLRAASRRAGTTAYFPGGTGTAYLDDHTPFLRQGIPAIDLIDGGYEYADGLEDTIDKLDPKALDAVGETVVELLRTLR